MSEVNITELNKFVPELIALYRRCEDAKEAFNAGVDAAVSASRARKTVVRKLIKAVATDKKDEVAAEAAETSDLIAAVRA